MRFNNFLLFLITFSVVTLAAVPKINTPKQCVMRGISTDCTEYCACDTNCKSVSISDGFNDYTCGETCPCKEEENPEPETPINPPEKPPIESGPENPPEKPPMEPGPVCVPPACI